MGSGRAPGVCWHVLPELCGGRAGGAHGSEHPCRYLLADLLQDGGLQLHRLEERPHHAALLAHPQLAELPHCHAIPCAERSGAQPATGAVARAGKARGWPGSAERAGTSRPARSGGGIVQSLLLLHEARSRIHMCRPDGASGAYQSQHCLQAFPLPRGRGESWVALGSQDSAQSSRCAHRASSAREGRVHGSGIVPPGRRTGALALGREGLAFLLPTQETTPAPHSDLTSRRDRSPPPKSDLCLCRGQILRPGSLLEARIPITAGHLGSSQHAGAWEGFLCPKGAGSSLSPGFRQGPSKGTRAGGGHHVPRGAWRALQPQRFLTSGAGEASASPQAEPKTLHLTHEGPEMPQPHPLCAHGTSYFPPLLKSTREAHPSREPPGGKRTGCWAGRVLRELPGSSPSTTLPKPAATPAPPQGDISPPHPKLSLH